jgi:hypothetical protein
MVMVACVALALTATAGADTASASKFVPETGASVYKGASTTLAMYMQGLQFSCYPETFEALAAQTNALEAVVGAGPCGISGSAPLKMNGCKFIFHPGAEESAGHFGGTFDIGPAGCGPITIVSKVCEITIYPKTGLTAHYTNVGEGSKAEVVIDLSATGLETSGKGSACSGGSGGEIEGTWHMAAYNSSGTQKGVHVAAHPPVGLYVAGKKSEEEAAQPKFNAEEYPVSITGGQSGVNSFYTESGESSCSTVSVTGSASAATSTLTLDPTFGGCVSLGLESTASTSGCHYVFHVTNSGPPYAGSLELACEAGHQLEFSPQSGGKSICTTAFPAQTLGTVKYENLGTGSGRYVLANNIFGSGLQYSISGGAGKCGKEGSHSDGEFEGGIKLEGKAL